MRKAWLIASNENLIFIQFNDISAFYHFYPEPNVLLIYLFVLRFVKNDSILICSFYSRFQDEMEGLRSEMLEMRDMYMEEDVYQLQELRQQLEQVRSFLKDGFIAGDLRNLLCHVLFSRGNLISLFIT